jgi:hypothetical protein
MDDACKPKAFSQINADKIKSAVFETMFENFIDVHNLKQP